MPVLAWWTIPVGAVLIALVVAYLVTRNRRDESRRSIREFQQFRSALGQQPRRRGD